MGRGEEGKVRHARSAFFPQRTTNYAQHRKGQEVTARPTPRGEGEYISHLVNEKKIRIAPVSVSPASRFLPGVRYVAPRAVKIAKILPAWASGTRLMLIKKFIPREPRARV